MHHAMLHDIQQIMSVPWKQPFLGSSFQTRVGVRHTIERENSYINEIPDQVYFKILPN